VQLEALTGQQIEFEYTASQPFECMLNHLWGRLSSRL
jgi:hypothetical protein